MRDLQQDPTPHPTTLGTRDDQDSAYVAEHSVLNTSASPAKPRFNSDKPSIAATERVTKLRTAVLKASEADVLPKEPLRLALIDSFFTNIGHTVPVVSRSEVCEPHSSILLQQAVCLAGGLTRHPHPQHSVFQALLYEKIKLLLAMNVESNKLIVLKSQCLLTLWSPDASNIVSLDSPWHANGHAIRLAVQMGLHRKSTYTGRSDASCRRRIWWILYVCFHNTLLHP